MGGCCGLESVEGHGFGCLVGGLALAVGSRGFGCLVGELYFVCALLEVSLLLVLLRLDFEFLVGELCLVCELLEVADWLGVVDGWRGLEVVEGHGFGCLVGELALAVESRGFGCLVGELCFVCALLEVSVWYGWTSSAWCMDGGRCGGGLPGRVAGDCSGGCGGAFCTYTLSPGPFFPPLGCPPGVRAPWRGGGAGAGLVSCVGLGDGLVVLVRGLVPVLAPFLRPSLPCSTLASLEEPSPALAPPLRSEGRCDVPLVD